LYNSPALRVTFIKEDPCVIFFVPKPFPVLNLFKERCRTGRHDRLKKSMTIRRDGIKKKKKGCEIREADKTGIL